jgi:hypothetical protein
VGLVVVLVLGVSCGARAPLPEGNTFVRGLVGAQRQREEAVSLYTYDVTEREELDRNGRPAANPAPWGLSREGSQWGG